MMRSLPHVYVLVSSGAVFLLAGCISGRVTTTDTVPAGAEKGYVEFSPGNKEAEEFAFGVSHASETIPKRVGEFGKWNEILRVATQPGEHLFVVFDANAFPRGISIKVSVLKNQVTPVKILVQNYHDSIGGNGNVVTHTKSGRIAYEIQTPRPFVKP